MTSQIGYIWKFDFGWFLEDLRALMPNVVELDISCYLSMYMHYPTLIIVCQADIILMLYMSVSQSVRSYTASSADS